MKKNRLLLSGILGIVLGVIGLVVAKYMLTNYAFSQAQTNRSHVVRYIGILLLLVGLISVILYVLKTIKPSARPKS